MPHYGAANDPGQMLQVCFAGEIFLRQVETRSQAHFKCFLTACHAQQVLALHDLLNF